jgi:hypothetical protein
MRDGLGRMEEFTLWMAYQARHARFDILSIAPQPEQHHSIRITEHRDNVICLQQARNKRRLKRSS